MMKINERTGMGIRSLGSHCFFFFLLKNRTKEFEKDKTNEVNFFEGWEEITMNYEYEEYDS